MTSSIHERFWRQCLLVAALSLLPIIGCLILALTFLLPEDFFSRSAQAQALDVAAPGTVVVSQTGDGQYSTINAAVAAAQPGATILVRPGIYRERVIVDKDITLIGDRGGVTVKCYRDGCMTVRAAKATIRNFTIIAKSGLISMFFERKNPSAVLVTHGQSVIEACDVTANNGPGLVIRGSSAAPEIRNVRAHNCKYNGMFFTDNARGVVENSEIYGNEWAGIRSDFGAAPVVRRSRIHSGKMDGVLMDHRGDATLEECEISANLKSGVHVREGSTVSVTGSRISNNGGRGIMVHDDSFVKADACDVSENTNGGIDVTDYSDAQILNTKVHHEQIAGIVVSNDSTATVEGATIFENAVGLRAQDNGKPIVRKSVFRSHSYSAIEVKTGGEPLIEQSQIYGGQSAGIYFFEGGAGRVNDCSIFGNMMSNIVIRSGSHPQISKTSLSESGYAGVLVMENGQGSVTDCRIFNNQLGIEVRGDSSLQVEASKLTGNARGAWNIVPGARVVRQGNTE